jgi:putative lipoprotein
MKPVRMLVALLAAAVLALPAVALAQTTASVKGTAVIRQRVALPNNTVVTFQLLDASRAGGQAVVLAEQKVTTNGQQAPFQFELKYDPAKIQQNGTYVVQGNVTVDGRLRYTTTSQYRVITAGNPTSITITLEAIPSAPLPGTAAGGTLLSLTAALLALVLAIRWLRPRLARAEA